MYSGDMADATVFIMENVSFKDLVPDGSDRDTEHTYQHRHG